jgi:hypothetical protein
MSQQEAAIWMSLTKTLVPSLKIEDAIDVMRIADRMFGSE